LTTWISDNSEAKTANISLKSTGRSSCQDRKCIFRDEENYFLNIICVLDLTDMKGLRRVLYERALKFPQTFRFGADPRNLLVSAMLKRNVRQWEKGATLPPKHTFKAYFTL
jgi:hypothetical protein